MVSRKQKEKVEQREKAPSPVDERHMATLLEKRSPSEPATVPPGGAGISLPPSWRRSALVGVKAVHSLLYFAIEYCMGYLIYAGLKGREDRRTAMAAGVVGGESLIFLGNRCRCPLTAVAEHLGAASGSVTDIYLPGFLASHLVLIHVPLLALALCLHVRNFQRQVKSMRSAFLLCLLTFISLRIPWELCRATARLCHRPRRHLIFHPHPTGKRRWDVPPGCSASTDLPSPPARGTGQFPEHATK